MKFDGAGRARDLGDIGMGDAGSGKDDRVHDDRLLPLIRTNDLRFADSGGAPAYESQGDSPRVRDIAIHRTPDTGDVVARGGDEFGQFRGALQCGFRAAGTENPRRGGLNHGFEGFAQVGAFVERAVKRYGQGACEVHQSSCSRHVDSAIFLQDSQHNAIHAAFGGDGNGALHLGELGFRIGEVSRPRADHRVDGDVHFFADGEQQFAARREAADGEVGAQFDAVRAAAFGGDGLFYAVHADFEQEFPGHR